MAVCLGHGFETMRFSIKVPWIPRPTLRLGMLGCVVVIGGMHAWGQESDSTLPVFPALVSDSSATKPTHPLPSEPSIDLPTKTVKGKRDTLHESSTVGQVRLTRQDILRTAATQGDPVRAVSTLPGVSTLNDVSVKPFVRGGKADETRVYLDGVQLLQPYHFAGAYSPFNPELINRLDLYRSAVPASQRDALSGALSVVTREPKGVEAVLDLSLLRANAMVAFPLPGNVEVYGGWHTFFYDQTFKSLLAVMDAFIDNDDFEEYRNDIKALVDLPSFRDFQIGAFWHPKPNMTLHWNTLMSKDRFTQYQRAWEFHQNGRRVSPQFYDWASVFQNTGLSRHKGLDTLGLIAVHNDVHFLRGEWKVSPRWTLGGNASLQFQRWDIGFYDGIVWHDSITDDNRYAGYFERAESDYLLKLEKRILQAGVEAKYAWGENHALAFGVQREMWFERYHTTVPRPIYELMVNGNSDLLDGLSLLNPEGLHLLRKDYPSLPPVHPATLVLLQRFDYKDTREQDFGAVYASDRWDISPSSRLEAGVRLEHAETPNHWFLSPRIAWYQRLTPRDELTIGLGHYAQSDLPFYALDANPLLLPEKVWQGSWSLTHDFGKSVQFEIEHWYKRYDDLVTLDLNTPNSIDWKSVGIDSIFAASLDPKYMRIIQSIYGIRHFNYSNEGEGEAQGLELSVRYRPTPEWTGWFSGEQSASRRQDHPGEKSYPFRNHRPWALNWVNWWHFPNDYALGTRLRYSAGQAYTPYYESGSTVTGTFVEDGSVGQDTLLSFGARNSGRYAPYLRFDIRISHDTKWFGHPAETFFEIWNAFNDPNFIVRDNETGQFKSIQMNYPVPVLFLGFRWRY
jgi:TonB dependent receptor/TonB-dependent Receptor Plug Domain